MALYAFQCTGDPSHYWEEEGTMSEMAQRFVNRVCPRCNSPVIAAVGTSGSRAFAAFQAAAKETSIQITPNG